MTAGAHERIAQLPPDKRAELVSRLRHRSSDRGDRFTRYAAKGPEALRVFCFPHAGGGGSVYRTWEADLPGTEVWAAHLPGREARLAEPAHRRIEPLVKELHEAIAPLLDRPFVFFGHSMGALVAFELARSLRRENMPPPAMLLLAAFRAPQLPNPNIRIHHLPDEVLKTVLGKEGTPRQVLESRELMRALLPTLRADLELCDTYEHLAEPPLDLPFSVYGGLQDVRVSRADLEEWRVHTDAGFRLTMLPGSHLFLESARDPLLAEVSRDLRPALDQARGTFA